MKKEEKELPQFDWENEIESHLDCDREDKIVEGQYYAADLFKENCGEVKQNGRNKRI